MKQAEDIEWKIKRQENELNRILGWISAAGSRISLTLPLASAMLGTSALSFQHPANVGWFDLLLILIAIILLIGCLACTALASFPRTDGPDGSLVYFGGIAALSLSDYVSATEEETNIGYMLDLTQQCHRNSQIAALKFKWVQRSLKCLFASLPFWLYSVSLLMYQGATNVVN